jgi:serine/threonine protein phosphatase PrpC
VILGVFDGHGLFGHFCSYTIQQLLIKLLLANPNYKTNLELALRQAFLKVDEALRCISQNEGKFSVLLSGSTATVIVHREGMLYVASVGDSRAVLCRTDSTKPSSVLAEPLTIDHSPELEPERKRIEAANGEVRRPDGYSPARVFARDANYPGLAMSRAIGDEIAKSVGVTADPEVRAVKVESQFEFVTLSSDGVWEFLSNEEVVDIIHRNGKQRAGMSAATVSEQAFNTWLEKENNTTDDITCLIYYFN